MTAIIALTGQNTVIVAKNGRKEMSDSVLRPAFEKMKIKSYQKGYRQGYSKAIDDLVIIAMKQFTDFDLKNRYQSGSDYKVILRNVADQLKDGVKDAGSI